MNPTQRRSTVGEKLSKCYPPAKNIEKVLLLVSLVGNKYKKNLSNFFTSDKNDFEKFLNQNKNGEIKNKFNEIGIKIQTSSIAINGLKNVLDAFWQTESVNPTDEQLKILAANTRYLLNHGNFPKNKTEQKTAHDIFNFICRNNRVKAIENFDKFKNFNPVNYLNLDINRIEELGKISTDIYDDKSPECQKTYYVTD